MEDHQLEEKFVDASLRVSCGSFHAVVTDPDGVASRDHLARIRDWMQALPEVWRPRNSRDWKAAKSNIKFLTTLSRYRGIWNMAKVSPTLEFYSTKQ